MTCQQHDKDLIYDVMNMSTGKAVAAVCEDCLLGLAVPPGHEVQRRMFSADHRNKLDPRAVADPKKLVEYVVGFLFDRNHDYVVLIEKKRPGWMAGLLNGVGGGVEPGESPEDAMRREFKEETGVEQFIWRRFCTLKTYNGERHLRCVVHYLAAFASIKHLRNCRTTTDERIGVYRVEIVDNLAMPVMHNLKWIIPMALSWSLYGDVIYEVVER